MQSAGTPGARPRPALRWPRAPAAAPRRDPAVATPLSARHRPPPAPALPESHVDRRRRGCVRARHGCAHARHPRPLRPLQPQWPGPRETQHGRRRWPALATARTPPRPLWCLTRQQSRLGPARAQPAVGGHKRQIARVCIESERQICTAATHTRRNDVVFEKRKAGTSAAGTQRNAERRARPVLRLTAEKRTLYSGCGLLSAPPPSRYASLPGPVADAVVS